MLLRNLVSTKFKPVLLIIIGCFFIQVAAAQQKEQRPKIGLTLSGGGAKGLAHIGILEAIDSAGLKIDYITGTSMGSVVGGLYAAGYSGDSIESVARSLDWDVLFSTKPTLNQISIEEKSEYEKYALTVPFEKGKFKIGHGIIDGQELWLKLAQLFEPVYNITDFSKLPIPFICIGTDVETGNPVEMKQGNIVNAIRASMAIPTVFTPVMYDNKLIVDGGVVNNFPVLVAKKMGADYVIGVNLNQGLLKASQLESAFDILLQIGFFKDAEIAEKQKAACNLYIMPELNGYSTGSFASSDSIIDLGKDAGNLYYPYFKKLADSLNAIYGKNDFEKNRLPVNKHINIRKYTAEGFNRTEEQFFFGLLDLKVDKNYSYKEVNEAIHRVYGSRYYNIIRYDFIPDPTGGTEMHFTVEENPLTDVKLAINYNSFTQVGLFLNLTARDLLLKESRALITGSLSANPQLYAEYFKYISKKRTARAVLDYYYQNTDFPLYNNFRLYQEFRSYYSCFDFQLQKNVNTSSYLAVGQQLNRSKIKTEETPSLTYNGNNKYWFSYLSYVNNTTNKKYYPTSGWLVKAKAGYVYGNDIKYEYSYSDSTVNSDSISVNNNNYFKLMLNATHYSEINSKFSWSQNVALCYLVVDNPFIADQYLVGGMTDIILNQVPFAGLSVSEIKTGSIASAAFALQYSLSKKAYLTGRINAALYNFHDVGFQNINSKNNLLTGYGLTFGYNSVIGPLDLTVMYCDQDAMVRNYINIGFIF